MDGQMGLAVGAWMVGWTRSSGSRSLPRAKARLRMTSTVQDELARKLYEGYDCSVQRS